MSDHSVTMTLLRERLASLAPERLEIIDESHRHAGHAGARDGAHFRLDIVAAVFAGHNTVTRHRMIFAAAGDLMHGRIHALAIHARSPEDV